MLRIRAVVTGALVAGAVGCSDVGQGPVAGDVSFAKGTTFPDVIPLPIAPEGIAVGTGHTFYVGNLAPSAVTLLPSIYVGNLRTGEVTPLVGYNARQVLGLTYDDRSGYLFTARGGTGYGVVIDAATGATVAEMQFAVPSSAAPTFVNDVIVTRTAAYFTDSRRPVMYRVPLGEGGALVGGFDIVPLTGDFVQGPITCTLPVIGGVARPGPLFANGIEATPNGEWLIINSLANGRLYRVDPATGEALRIDLGSDDVCLADGNLLAGRTLYVMQNLASRMAVVQLSQDYLSGTVEGHLVGTHPMTTMARFGNSIYAVTAGFGFLLPPTSPAGHPFQVVKLGM